MGLKKLILNFCLRIVDLLTFWIQPEPGTITFSDTQSAEQ